MVPRFLTRRYYFFWQTRSTRGTHRQNWHKIFRLVSLMASQNTQIHLLVITCYQHTKMGGIIQTLLPIILSKNYQNFRKLTKKSNCRLFRIILCFCGTKQNVFRCTDIFRFFFLGVKSFNCFAILKKNLKNWTIGTKDPTD